MSSKTHLFPSPAGKPATFCRKFAPFFIALLILALLFLQSDLPAQAAAILSIEPLTWNTLGLDGDDVNAGPDQFPVGARVCNTGDAPATDLTVAFVWDSDNAFIDLNGSDTHSISTLNPDQCREVYFTVRITRHADAFDNVRQYHIQVNVNGVTEATTPTPREIYVERFFSSPGITTESLSGPTQVFIGQSVQYVVTSDIGDEGFDQLQHILQYNNSLFRLVSVSASYEIPENATNDRPYANACGWIEDPDNITEYRTCAGADQYPGGVVGGSVTTTYTLEALTAGTTGLSQLITGLQDEEFLYNVGQPAPPFNVTIQNATVTPTITTTPTQTSTSTTTSTPASPTPTPTFTGTIQPSPGATKLISPTQAAINQTMTFTIVVRNTGHAPAEAVTLIDDLTVYPYLNIDSAQTNRGTVSISGRRVVVTIGVLAPNEEATVTIVVRVNNTASGTVTINNTAQITFLGGSINSNTHSFRVVGSPVLPGTGYGPASATTQTTGWVTWLKRALFLGAGLTAGLLGLGLRRRQNRTGWVFFGLGGIFCLAAVLVMLGKTDNLLTPVAQVSVTPTLEVSIKLQPGGILNPSATPNPLEVEHIVVLPTSDGPLPTLPVFPIPDPSFTPPAAGEPQPDISPIRHITIPAIGVDTVVAFVPFDGHTWLIEGLQREIAWMGNTSWPGLGGNTALAGHVTVRGLGEGPFRNLGDLKAGDRVLLFTEENIYTYQVREKMIVDETDFSILDQTDGSQITLVTCVDWHNQYQIYLRRLIVSADLVSVDPLTQTSSN
jgi:LPXTG-site transpeptidase (sortase) family protein